MKGDVCHELEGLNTPIANGISRSYTEGWTNFTKVTFCGAAENLPITGDWDGDGVDTVGAYVADKWRWFLKGDQLNGWSNVSPVKFAVVADYVALAGDWE